MRFGRIRIRRSEGLRLAMPLFVGFVIGTLMVYLNADFFTGSFSLGRVTKFLQSDEAGIQSSLLFWYVLKKRIGLVWVLAVLSTTVLGAAAVYLSAVWNGVCAGMILTVFLFLYGGKGILLFAGGIMPHFLFYVPAYCVLLNWCLHIFRMIRFSCGMSLETHENHNSGKAILLLQLLFLHGVVIIGVFLESYVNPIILKELIKLF